MEAKKMNFDLQADMQMRKGVYANFFTAINGESETILDFYFLDMKRAGDDGATTMGGTMVARVVVSRDKAVELKQMLERHLSNEPDGGSDGPGSAVDGE